jgi:hypothetical protein
MWPDFSNKRKNGRNVSGFRRSEFVAYLADQFFALVTEEFAKTVRDADKSSVEVNHVGVFWGPSGKSWITVSGTWSEGYAMRRGGV